MPLTGKPTPTRIMRVGAFDITKYSDAELWSRLGAFARLYAGITGDFRLLAYTQPFPLEGALQTIRDLLAATGDPRRRDQIAAYRRFIEEIVASSSLKSSDYYVMMWSDKSPRILANMFENGLKLPVYTENFLPPLIRQLYREAPHYIYPAEEGTGAPLISFLYSYDLKGQVSFGTPLSFLRLPCPLCLAVDVITTHPNKAMGKLTMAFNRIRADVMGRTGNEAPDAEKEQAYMDVQQAMNAVANERMGLHQVGIGIAVMGNTKEQLEENVEQVISNGIRNQVQLRRAFSHQKQAMTFFLPQRVDGAITDEYRNTLSPGVAALSPFGYEVRKEINGPFVAINFATGSPFFLDKFSLPAYNEVTLGRTGSGKTFGSLLRAYRETMFGIQTIFIDPQGNGRKVTEAVNGSYNYLRLSAESAMNILDYVQPNLMSQISHVITMLSTLLSRDLDIQERNAVDEAMSTLYSKLPADEEHWRPTDMPRLEDLAHAVRETAPSLTADLTRYVEGSLSEAFNIHTTLNLNLDRKFPIITYDLQDVEGEFQPLFVFALLSNLERVIRHRKGQQKPTNIIWDEFGVLSAIPGLSNAAALLAKRVRAWKVGIQVLDQNMLTFQNDAGQKILENSLVKTIMRVDDTAADLICQMFNLTEHHRQVMLSAGLGEGVLIVESKAYHVYFQASRAELEMLIPHSKQKKVRTLDLPE